MRITMLIVAWLGAATVVAASPASASGPTPSPYCAIMQDADARAAVAYAAHHSESLRGAHPLWRVQGDFSIYQHQSGQFGGYSEAFIRERLLRAAVDDLARLITDLTGEARQRRLTRNTFLIVALNDNAFMPIWDEAAAALRILNRHIKLNRAFAAQVAGRLNELALPCYVETHSDGATTYNILFLLDDGDPATWRRCAAEETFAALGLRADPSPHPSMLSYLEGELGHVGPWPVTSRILLEILYDKRLHTGADHAETQRRLAKMAGDDCGGDMEGD